MHGPVQNWEVFDFSETPAGLESASLLFTVLVQDQLKPTCFMNVDAKLTLTSMLVYRIRLS